MIVSGNNSTSVRLIPKRDKFLSSCNHQQEWDLPYLIIQHIAKNPLRAKIYQKLIQTCKYFFVKNPIIVVKRLFLNWEDVIFLNHFLNPFGIKNAACKLWITDTFNNITFGSPTFSTSSVIPHIYRSDIKELHLSDQEISYNEFMFLSSKVENVSLHRCTVKHEDGSTVPLEILFKYLLNAKDICFYDTSNSSLTLKKAKELLELLNFSKNKKNVLFQTPDMPPRRTFFSCHKKYSYIDVSICYNDSHPDN